MVWAAIEGTICDSNDYAACTEDIRIERDGCICLFVANISDGKYLIEIISSDSDVDIWSMAV